LLQNIPPYLHTQNEWYFPVLVTSIFESRPHYIKTGIISVIIYSKTFGIFKAMTEEKNIFSDLPLSELLNEGKSKWTKECK
jgi:hypothetical protein